MVADVAAGTGLTDEADGRLRRPQLIGKLLARSSVAATLWHYRRVRPRNAAFWDSSRGFCPSLRNKPRKFLDSLRLDIVQDEQRSCHFVPLGTPFLLAPLDCDCELRQVYLPFDPIGDRVD